MKWKMWLMPLLFVLLIIVAFPYAAVAGVPDVDNVMVTDVTTVSFSVIWAASEAGFAAIEVYEDEDGTFPVSGAVVTPHPVKSGDEAIKTAAEGNGVMKVMVTGLEPDTLYYFMTITTSKSTGDVVNYPIAAPFDFVKTENETVRTYESSGDVIPFSNDLIIEACYLNDGVTPAEGTLLLATVKGGSHPVTSFVGDGVSLPYAIIDLNNMFSSETYENLDLSQGANLTLLNFGGFAGNSIVTHNVPQDDSLSEVKEGEFALKAGWNMFSTQLEPDDTNIGTILESLGDKIEAVWAYSASSGEWLSIDNNIPSFLWDLTDLHSYSGYWFVMNDEASLIVNGNFNSGNIQLYEGWNLVGHKFIETMDIMKAIAPVLDKLEAVWTYDTVKHKWLSIDMSVPSFLWDLVVMEPGKAYWFVMNQDCVDAECQW